MNDAPLRAALLATLGGLVVPEEDDGSGETSNTNLRWMIAKCVSEIDTFPTDKTSRWIGFVQGVLATKGTLSVSAERDRTRPLFHAAYRQMGIAPPASASKDDPK